MTGLLVERTPRTWLTRVRAHELPDAVAEVAAQGGGPLRWWVTEPVPDDEAAAAAAGLVPERELWQMRCVLPLADDRSLQNGPIPGREITTRPFVVGQDEEAWLTVNNRAFDAHPEQGGWTPAMLAARQAEPWFDPEGFLLHYDGDGIGGTGLLAGFVWTKVHGIPPAHQPALGEIYVIGVDPDFAGRGLGRSLTFTGFDWLHRRRSVETGMLYVDIANEPAMRLYRGLGLTRHHADHAFAGEIAPL